MFNLHFTNNYITNLTINSQVNVPAKGGKVTTGVAGGPFLISAPGTKCFYNTRPWR